MSQSRGLSKRGEGEGGLMADSEYNGCSLGKWGVESGLMA